MRIFTRRLLAFVLFPAAVLFAQDLAGTWQGTVRPPDNPVDLRTIIKISRDGDALKANFYSIDQTPQPFPVTLTIQGSAVKITIPGIGAGFEGKLSADGNTIAGTIKRGFPSQVPWTLKRVADDEAWAIPKMPGPSKPMAADADPVFEVATVKLTDPDATARGIRIQSRTLSASHLSLTDLIVYSYDVHVKQLIGLPAWAESEHYDITARPEGEGAPSDKQWRVMIRKLLADRFQLAFHRETKELAVFAITVPKSGAKISKSVDPNNPTNVFVGAHGKILATNATIADFATVLQRITDRPVVDKTGLTDQYDFVIVWTPDDVTAAAAAAAAPTLSPGDRADLPPDLATAFQQQLGLRLDATKTPIEVLVIDKAQKPSDN